MATQSNDLADARVQLNRKHELMQEQVRTREEYDRNTYRLETFEVQLRMIQEELEALEGAGLKSLLAGLFRDKQQVIDKKRAVLATTGEYHQTCLDALDELRTSLEAIETEVADLGECEERYQAKLKDRANALETMPGDLGDQFRALSASQEELRASIRHYGRAIESADFLTTSLTTARQSMRSAGSQRMVGAGRGLCNVLLTQATKVSETGANVSLDNFAEALINVVADLQDNPGPEEQLLLDMIDKFQQKFALVQMDDSCTQSLEMDTSVSAMVAQMRELVKECEKELDAVEDHRREVLEQAPE